MVGDQESNHCKGFEMLKFVVLSVLMLGAGELYAARSSSRNLKSLTESDVEEKTKDIQDLDLADGGAGQKTVERITFLGPKTGWGFVSEECPQYSIKGKNIGSCSAGTLFKYRDVLSSSKNDMLLAVIRNPEGWAEPCLLPCDCIAAYDGDPEKVNIEIVANLRKYFLLSGKVESRKEAVLQKEYQKNPFYGLYQQAVNDYKTSIDFARTMQLEADQLTGIRKNRADEALREFKYKQAQLQVKMNECAQKYKEWKKNNPVDITKIQDAELNELSSELESVKTKVANLIPHEER
jgi:hypothetical protein